MMNRRAGLRISWLALAWLALAWLAAPGAAAAPDDRILGVWLTEGRDSKVEISRQGETFRESSATYIAAFSLA